MAKDNILAGGVKVAGRRRMEWEEQKKSVVPVESGNLPDGRPPGGWAGLEIQREKESWLPRAVGV